MVEQLDTPDAEGRSIRLTVDLQQDFALNQPLSPFAVSAFELLDALFRQLARCAPDEATPTEERIWDVWMPYPHNAAARELDLATSDIAARRYDIAETRLTVLLRRAPDFAEASLPLARRLLTPFAPLLALLTWADRQLHRLVTTPQPLRPDLGAAQRDMLLGVFTLADATVDEVMTPRLDMVAVDLAWPLEQVLAAFRRSEHTRIAVYDGTPDNITGIVFAKDLVPLALGLGDGGGRWQDLVRPAAFVPENKTLDNQLKDFQRGPAHLAIVVDEFGGTSGLARSTIGQMAVRIAVFRPGGPNRRCRRRHRHVALRIGRQLDVVFRCVSLVIAQLHHLRLTAEPRDGHGIRFVVDERKWPPILQYRAARVRCGVVAEKHAIKRQDVFIALRQDPGRRRTLVPGAGRCVQRNGQNEISRQRLPLTSNRICAGRPMKE